MSELGSLLELIHNAHACVTTVLAEYRDSIKPRPSLELYVERSELGETHTRWSGAGPFPQTVTITERIWLSKPDRLRVEVVEGRQLVGLGVLSGERWWRWNSARGAISGEVSSDQVPPLLLTPPLIEPVHLVAGLRFEPLGCTLRMGRKVVTARARLRRPSSAGATVSYELEFDAVHGTILRRSIFSEGQLVRLTEAINVAYDIQIEPERFVFEAPDDTDGRQFRDGVRTLRASARE